MSDNVQDPVDSVSPGETAELARRAQIGDLTLLQDLYEKVAPALYVWTRGRFDSIAAMVAAVLLFTSPRIVADLCSNLKDTPEMVFFALTLLAVAAAYERGSAPGVAASGMLWGLALGTKANALFLPAILVLTVVVVAFVRFWRA